MQTVSLQLNPPVWAGPATIHAKRVGPDRFRVWIKWDGDTWGGGTFEVSTAEDAIDCALSCSMPWDV